MVELYWKKNNMPCALPPIQAEYSSKTKKISLVMYRTWTHLADSILDKRVHSIQFSGHSDSRKEKPCELMAESDQPWPGVIDKGTEMDGGDHKGTFRCVNALCWSVLVAYMVFTNVTSLCVAHLKCMALLCWMRSGPAFGPVPPG